MRNRLESYSRTRFGQPVNRALFPVRANSIVEFNFNILFKLSGFVGTNADSSRAIEIGLNQSDSLTVVGDCAQSIGENPIFLM